LAERYGIGVEHAYVTLVGMGVEGRGEVLVEEGDQPAESRAPDQPLEVRSPGMVIGTVEAGARDELHETMEECLVAGVHPDGDGWLAAVATEAALADQDPDQQPRIESFHCDSPPPAWGCCYTVW
jgi:hypothetical protein